ncbi:maleylpyruvate isomerase N-terminal domain-containing protein [Actinoplanes utahensis]|uniref:Mycothiol-dependent maleylpyruvate isomerase metal-binding domain-containing protein n=1 Tax=Actinoplanes utahensis TaxID=1869 RepID=A0A0A6UJE7_ACTUT|nr:maleylpyruvate isomerase N-terminal domain-containing protein [Actinoplanes utahensis]KHD74434.1 hypothetical protein MB27_28860 [Actinoplanes utahensis]GIF34371.1 hypothetical protein Aut01nite_73570 [Actinoplanes utahensis]
MKQNEEDVRLAVSLAVGTLRTATGQDWDRRAGDLEWSVRETVEHIADDLFAYAMQLTPENPPQESYVPFGWRRSRPGAPALTLYAQADAGPDGLLQLLDAAGGLLAAVVAVTPPDRRSWHPYGVSDAAGFAAMGVVETLVHTHDVAVGLGLPWNPPEDLCDRVLRRLFRDVPRTTAAAWPVLLWATGRGEMPGHPRRAEWRWDGTPLD